MTINDALPALITAEGIYSNDASDPGGETVYGISRVTFPRWEGWSVVDGLKAKEVQPASWGLTPSLIGAVKDFYMTNFWLPAHIDYLPEQIQQSAFGCAVNQGVEGFTRLLQTAIRSMGYPLTVDGQMGPATLSAVALVSKTSAACLATALAWVRVCAYMDIVAAKPGQDVYLHGWLNRIRNGL